MERFFFTECMPYRVEVKGGIVVILNREYKVIYKGRFSDKIVLSEFFEDIGIGEANEKHSNYCYMYNKVGGHNPFGNTKGYRVKEMNDYFERLKHLTRYLGMNRYVDDVPYGFSEEDAVKVDEIKKTIEKSLSLIEDNIEKLRTLVGGNEIDMGDEAKVEDKSMPTSNTGFIG